VPTATIPSLYPSFSFDERAHVERRMVASDLSTLPHVFHVVDFDSEDEYDLGDEADPQTQASASKARHAVLDPAEANVFSSLLQGQEVNDPDDALHTIALDIDHRMRVVDSSTEGHGHLYIDCQMPWRDVKKLMAVMAEVGLLEPGYVKASERRLATHLRLPWETKRKPLPAQTEEEPF
jgi:hypothetical protein